MNTLGMITTSICAILTWLFIVPSPKCSNKKYRRLFWVLFIVFVLVAAMLTSAIGIHSQWYAQGLSIILCAIIASQISIHLSPNKNMIIDINTLKHKLTHAPNYEKPAHALMISLYYRDLDYERSVKYASLVVEMIDSIDPSDLIEPYINISPNIGILPATRI